MKPTKKELLERAELAEAELAKAKQEKTGIEKQNGLVVDMANRIMDRQKTEIKSLRHKAIFYEDLQELMAKSEGRRGKQPEDRQYDICPECGDPYDGGNHANCES